MGHRVGVRSLDGRDLCGIYHQFRTVRTEFQFVFSCTETIEFMVKFKLKETTANEPYFYGRVDKMKEEKNG